MGKLLKFEKKTEKAEPTEMGDVLEPIVREIRAGFTEAQLEEIRRELEKETD